MPRHARLAGAAGCGQMVLVLIALAGCTSSPKGLTEAQMAAERARPFEKAIAALRVWEAGGRCDGPERDEVVVRIKELEAGVSRWNRVGSFPVYEREARDRHTTVVFSFAEAALRRDCLDDADRQYRRLIEFYVGASHSGIRDRARTGIDDVRAARAARARK